MKNSRRAHVARREPHSLLELAERLPPASLPYIDPPQVQEGELPGFVALGLLGLFRATRSTRPACPVASSRRRCRCTDCRTQHRSRSRAGARGKLMAHPTKVCAYAVGYTSIGWR